MQELTIEQLNGIVSLMDADKINAALQQFGYRHASKNGRWEFNMFAVSQAEQFEGTETHEDVFGDREYCGNIYKGVKEYPGVTFAVVTIKRFHREKGIKITEAFECFVDAPINEEYEAEQAKVCTCEGCGKSFTVGQLCKVNKKLLCDECFLEELKNKRKS